MSRRLFSFFFFAVCVFLAAPRAPALADGSVMRMQQTAGPFIITVFTSPLAAGPIEISIMVQDSSNNDPVLDAEVRVRLDEDGAREHQTIRAEASRGRSKNKLLYAALVNLPEAGRWRIEVSVAKESRETRIDLAIVAAQPRNRLVAYWWAFAFPPLAIILFAINQWRSGKSPYSQGLRGQEHLSL